MSDLIERLNGATAGTVYLDPGADYWTADIDLPTKDIFGQPDKHYGAIQGHFKTEEMARKAQGIILAALTEANAKLEALEADNARLTKALGLQMDEKHKEAAEAKLWFGKAQEGQAKLVAAREALTPSGDTKFAYLGEFSFQLTRTDEDGDEYAEKVYVPWDTIKEIMAAIRARAALTD